MWGSPVEGEEEKLIYRGLPSMKREKEEIGREKDIEFLFPLLEGVLLFSFLPPLEGASGFPAKSMIWQGG